jgi:hypothetical protein
MVAFPPVVSVTGAPQDVVPQSPSSMPPMSLMSPIPPVSPVSHQNFPVVGPSELGLVKTEGGRGGPKPGHSRVFFFCLCFLRVTGARS